MIIEGKVIVAFDLNINRINSSSCAVLIITMSAAFGEYFIYLLHFTLEYCINLLFTFFVREIFILFLC